MKGFAGLATMLSVMSMGSSILNDIFALKKRERTRDLRSEQERESRKLKAEAKRKRKHDNNLK